MESLLLWLGYMSILLRLLVLGLSFLCAVYMAGYLDDYIKTLAKREAHKEFGTEVEIDDTEIGMLVRLS